eukprot:TRINITY_DN51545_c0_g1_i1.p1 TRINITY_DN51545_c0_g1~~TRINITY_DN51545_c0_g1_i1.p1  ORF type:complete len:462 (-),score=59.52 TRINITY_DN51545_c0_g1_i1:127-1512(-)
MTSFIGQLRRSRKSFFHEGIEDVPSMGHCISSASSSSARSRLDNKKRSIDPGNAVGSSVFGSGGSEERIAGCLQAGMKALQRARARSRESTSKKQGNAAPKTQHLDDDTSMRASFEAKGVHSEIEEYAPRTFENIRAAFGIHEDSHQLIISGPGGYKDMRFISTSDAAGKSHSWFLIVGDMRYMIKTCSDAEARILLEILPDYHEHVLQSDNTLLPRFFGLYLIEQADCMSRFIVMGNIFAARHPIVARFDIKGSTYGRKASEREQAKGCKATLKDRDLLHRGRPLVLGGGEGALEYLMSTLTDDTHWLESHQLLDYSMMVGLALRPHNDKAIFGRHTVEAITLLPYKAGDPDVMYVGIVDILTRFGFLKRCESMIGKCLRRDVSCKPPGEYAQRFRGFFRYVLRAKEEVGEGTLFSEDYEHGWLSRTSNDVVPNGRLVAGQSHIEMTSRRSAEPLLGEEQ